MCGRERRRGLLPLAPTLPSVVVMTHCPRWTWGPFALALLLVMSNLAIDRCIVLSSFSFFSQKLNFFFSIGHAKTCSRVMSCKQVCFNFPAMSTRSATWRSAMKANRGRQCPACQYNRRQWTHRERQPGYSSHPTVITTFPPLPPSLRLLRLLPSRPSIPPTRGQRLPVPLMLVRIWLQPPLQVSFQLQPADWDGDHFASVLTHCLDRKLFLKTDTDSLCLAIFMKKKQRVN